MLTWLLALLFGTLWTPTFTYRAVDAPGAWDTFPTDINNKSYIAGYYRPAGGPSAPHHGFVYDGAGYLTVDYPGALNTRIHAINDVGDICGDFVLASSPYLHAFTRRAGEFQEITIPQAILVSCHGINNAGDIFGLYESSGEQHTFILKASKQINITIPGAASPLQPEDINDSGQAAGYFMEVSGTILGFVRNPDSTALIEHPQTSDITLVKGISDDGLVVGRWNDSTQNLGFLWYRGAIVYDQIRVPTASGLTSPFGVNRSGEITGYFSRPNDSFGGFVAVPSSPFRVDRFTSLPRLVRPQIPVPLRPDVASPYFGL